MHRLHFELNTHVDRSLRATSAVLGQSVCIGIVLLGALAVARIRTDVFASIDIPVVGAVWEYSGIPAKRNGAPRRTYERAYSTMIDGIARIGAQSLNSIALLRICFDERADMGMAIEQIAMATSQINSEFSSQLSSLGLMQRRE